MVLLRSQMGSRPQDAPYSGAEDFVLREGREFPKAPLSTEQKQYVLACARNYGRHFQQRQCFYNSQMLLLAGESPWSRSEGEGRLTYCEGFGWRYIPTMHGWLVLDGTHVIDTTWRMDKPMGRGSLADRALGTWNDERSYFGVPFSRNYVRRYVLSHKHGGSVIGDYWDRHPLLTGAAPRDTWALAPVPRDVERTQEARTA
jgi:hypothetical protein